MSETDPLDRLSRVANQSEQPTPDFSDQLLNDLLGDLTIDGAAPTLSSVDHTTNNPTAEVIMLSPDRNQLPERSRTGLLIAASVAAIALIGGLLVVANRDDAQPADQPLPTVSETLPENLINPTSIFDGDTCTYNGPAEFVAGSEVTFTLVDNSATRSVGFSVWEVTEQTTAEEILDEGIFRTNGEQIPESAPAVVTDTGIQVTHLLDRPGFYALNCADRPDGGIPADHATLFTVVG